MDAWRMNTCQDRGIVSHTRAHLTHTHTHTRTHKYALANSSSTMFPVQTRLCITRTRAENTRIYVTHRLLFILRQFPSATMPPCRASGYITIATGATTSRREGKRGGKTGSAHRMYIIYRTGRFKGNIYAARVNAISYRALIKTLRSVR